MPLSVHAVVALLNAVAMLQCLIAGIVPAAPTEFQLFIQSTLDVTPTDSTFFVGLLETALVAVYCLATVAVGHLSKTIPPFSLLFRGLVLWLASVLVCGAARPCHSFPILLAGRMTTGAAEATVRVLALPLIEHLTPPPQRSLHVGIYYAGMCLASGVAYVYGSITARALGWDWAFYLGAVTMLPCLAVCHLACRHPILHLLPPQPLNHCGSMLSPSPPPSTRIADDLGVVLSCPVFVFSALGSGAINFTIQAMSTFAPAILVGLGVFTEPYAAPVFGALVMLSGLVGGPLAGLLLDRATRGHEDEDIFRCAAACAHRLPFLVVVLVAGGASTLVLAFAPSLTVLFAATMLVLNTSLFATLGSTSISMLLSVPPQHRELAMGVGLLIQNLVGNVPGPIVVGALTSWLAPGCGSVEVGQINPECTRDTNQQGLLSVWILMVGWLLWAQVAWPIAFVRARHRVALAKMFASGRNSTKKTAFVCMVDVA
ncbi:Aste57867_4505 [Aphanomyces stellatus]|uniref:Aste57867_4505 protein n=1 Tax=Aphanomyces stellatus TaxID=120398 RepID=A0A485KCX4_9STRA|nr:hypothetical protein As57867_004492 [Aphanomyces stellatus]VFT81615.1 Aste57867_4505 [Aphanomyces stellatus]